MPNDDNDRRSRRRNEDDDPEQAQEGLLGALEQLDRAAARVRQLVYRIRPMLRENGQEEPEGEDREDRRPVRGQFRRRSH
jgi:hypothetical protein